jgi:hypothetical protein
MKKTLLALAAAALATVGLATVAFGAVDSLGIESATVAPGGEVSVNVTAAATGDGVGAWNVDIEYDDSLVSLTGCTSATGICNPAFGENVARLVGASAGGLSGSVVLGTLTFTAGDEEGVADLAVTVNQLTDPTGEDLSVSPDDGTITIEVATPEPTPVPATPTPVTTGGTTAPTAVPTATVAALPSTGGAQGDSASMSAALLAIVGLAVVSGGVWAVARTRRDV